MPLGSKHVKALIQLSLIEFFYKAFFIAGKGRLSEDVKLSMYAVAARFNLGYPMDYELLRKNLQRLDSISLVSIGKCVSDISENIINLTFLKSKEIELQKEVATGKRLRYNNIKEKSEEVEENGVLRGATRGRNKKSTTARVQRTGEYGRNSGENQGEYAKQLGGRNELYEGISEPDLRIHEIGLSFRERGGEPVRDVSGSIHGEEAGISLDGNSEASKSVYEIREAELDEGMEHRERGRSNILGDDFSLKRSDNQGSSRSVEEMQIMIMLFKIG